jgi:hypothetical protein
VQVVAAVYWWNAALNRLTEFHAVSLTPLWPRKPNFHAALLSQVAIIEHEAVRSRWQKAGNACRSEAVTTNSFQDPAYLRPFLNQLQDTPTIQASRFNRLSILAEGRKKWSTWI